MSATAQSHSAGRQFVRFATSQRIEHVVLLVAFTVLALTGLIQKFNQTAIAENMIQVMGGIETTRLIHRFFAIVLIIQATYHGVNAFYKFVLKRNRPYMLPTPQDLRDAVQMVQYFLGRRKEQPLFDRYDFRQKLEYWAMVWGTIIMAITGLMMWFPIQVTTFLSGQWVVAAKAAHGAEAILAVLSILFWHMYGAHLNAATFPMDKSIFNGNISQERMIHEHPLEYARIMEEEKQAAAAASAAQQAPIEMPQVKREENGAKQEG